MSLEKPDNLTSEDPTPEEFDAIFDLIQPIDLDKILSADDDLKINWLPNWITDDEEPPKKDINTFKRIENIILNIDEISSDTREKSDCILEEIKSMQDTIMITDDNVRDLTKSHSEIYAELEMIKMQNLSIAAAIENLTLIIMTMMNKANEA